MPNDLNKGRHIVGNTGVGTVASVSYGDQSPADDAVPRPWKVGDVRYYQSTNGNASKVALKWVCITAGTPGTWQLIETPPNWPVLQSTLLFRGGYSHPGNETFMAPATADWAVSDEGFPLSNIIPIPPTANLSTVGQSGPPPTILSLTIWIANNNWDTPTPNGMLFRIRLSDGTVLGSGTVNADSVAVGAFTPISVQLASGVLDGQMGIYASLESDPAAGDASLSLVAVLSLFRDCPADYPS